jgi:Carbohydrate family 9 binding domain-like/Domain of unknown function (DUF5916)
VRATLALLSVLLSAAAIAQPRSSDDDTKSVRIVRAPEPPVIDGRLDEAVWRQALMIDDFHQVRPVDGAPPTERTEVYLMYDTDYLYIGANMFDSEPDQIAANVMTHGSGLGQDDRIAIVIDPFNAGRNGYRFETNANGIRHEALYTSTTSFQSEWTVIWDTASHVDERGWSFEMAIPFKSLPFNPNIDTWGFNFGRAIRRKGEEDAWVSRNRSYNPSIVGHVSGFTGMDQGRGLDVVPSMSVGERREFDPGTNDTSTEPSLDVFYRVTPSLNASLTVNTDFSATEVDDRQVNLTRFNLFFPEKRDFFLNDADLFEFGRIGTSANQAATAPSRQSGRPFFSRRLGLSATGQEVDLEVGGKLSGRIGRFSIGALAVRQGEFETIHASNAVVARVQADVFRESSVGFILTDGDPNSSTSNSLAGLDFLFRNSRLPGGRTLEAQAWYQQSDTEGASGNDTAFGLGIDVPNAEGVRGGLAVKELERNFNPALGFVSRRGVRDWTADVGYTHFLNRGIWQSMFAGVDFQRVNLVEGGLQTEVMIGRLLELQTRTRDNIDLSYTANKEVVAEDFVIYEDNSPDGMRQVIVPAGSYSFEDIGFSISTGNQRRISGGLTYRNGDFYDGTRTNVGGNVEWRPSANFNLRFAYDLNDVELPGGAFTTRLIQLRAEYVFSLRLSWSNLIQYDNVSEVLGFNSRLRWVPRPGQEGFIVLNHNLQDVDKDGNFQSQLSDLSVKFSYTFRF